MPGTVRKRIKQFIKRTAVGLCRKVRQWDEQTHPSYEPAWRMEQEGTLTDARKQQLNGEAFLQAHGYPIRWKEPRSFNEKIMWGILYYQNPLRVRCNDKFSVRGYVEEVLGPGHTAVTYGWWTDPDDIDFDRLPRQFVLKVNQNGGGGGNLYVRDKSGIDTDAIREQLRAWMAPENNIYYLYSFRWDAQFDAPVIYAEEYLPPAEGADLPHDYKLNCYNGVCRDLFVGTKTEDRYCMDWFDRDWNRLQVSVGGSRPAPCSIKRPEHFDEMLAMAEKLAKPFPYIRVDLYEVGDRVLVGEMTFAFGGGRASIEPKSMDLSLGEHMQMPEFLDFDRLRQSDPLPAWQACRMEDSLTPEMTRRCLERRAFTSLFYWPELGQPRTLNEKFLWTALFWRDPLLSVLADRYETKRYVAGIVGEQYVIPDIGVYTDPDAIGWEGLPEQFAAKSTAGRGRAYQYFVRSKGCDSEGVFKATAGEWVLPWNTLYYQQACLPGWKATPRILIEQWIEGPAKRLDEYRFYCSRGRVKLVCAVCEQETERESCTYLEPESWEALPVRQHGMHKRTAAARPERLGEMMELCGRLSADFPLVRIDCIAAGERVYVNGMSCGAGLIQRLEPVEWDEKLGERFSL